MSDRKLLGKATIAPVPVGERSAAAATANESGGGSPSRAPRRRSGKWTMRMRVRFRRVLRQAANGGLLSGCITGFVTVLAVTGLRLAIEPLLGVHVPVVLFVLPVLAAAYVGGIGAGLFTTAAGLLAASFVLLEPRGLPWVQTVQDAAILSLFVLVGLTVTAMCEGLRRARFSREQVTRSLRLADARLRMALSAAETVAWELHLESGGLSCSEGGEAMLGVKDGPFETMLDGVLPADRLVLEQAIRATIEQGRTLAAEFRRSGVDGGVRWIRLQGDVTRDARGRAVRLRGVAIDVTARRLAEMLRRESESRFRQLADSLPALIWMSDERGQGIYFNATWLELTGRSLEEERGDGWQASLHAQDKEAHQVWVQAHRRRRPFNVRLRLRRRDGTWRWMLCVGVPRFAADGQFLGFVGSCMDVTEQHETEHALRESEQRFRRTFDQAAVGIVQATVDGTLVEVNPGFCRILGFERDELVGQSVFDLTVAEDRLVDEAHAARVVAGEIDSYTLEKRFIHKDGHGVWTRVSNSAVRAADGQVQLAVGIVQDIDAAKRADEERRAAEQALRHSEARIRHLFNGSNDWVLVFTMGEDGKPGRFIEVNDEATRRLGYTRQELLEMSQHEIVDPSSAQEQNLRRLREAGRLQFDSVHVTRDGRPLDVEVSATWIEVDGRAAVQAICRDVTARREAEERLRRATEELAAANRAKDEFLAALSHELRNPLNPVLLTLSSYEGDDSLPEHLREDLQMMRQNVELEARLIDDLLDLTRVSQGKFELHLHLCDLKQVLDLTIDICCGDRSSDELPALVVQHQAAQTQVFADSARLQQIFWNLLNNALKFTDPGGIVAVTTSNFTDEDGSEMIRVEVADTGIGIDPRIRESIFGAFEQGGREVTRRYGGLGLGLAISRKLAEQHSGRIQVESMGAGTGSTFWVELPLQPVPEAVEMVGPEGPPAEAGGRRTMRVLLVEDHLSTAKVMARLLARLGHDVATTHTVAAALAAAEAGHEAGTQFDIVLSDLGLPDGSGHDLMRQLRDRFGLRGIALSGYGMEHDHISSRNAGFDDHLTKPVDLQRLTEALDRYSQELGAAAESPAQGGVPAGTTNSHTTNSATTSTVTA